MTEGRDGARLGADRVTVARGQVLVVPAGEPHVYGADPDTPWTIWWMHVTGPDVADLLHAARMSAARPVVTLREPYSAAALIEQALERMEHDDSVPSLVAAAGAAWHFMALLAADQVSGRPQDDPVTRAREYLQSHAGTRTSVADLAALVGLSPSRLAEPVPAADGDQHPGVPDPAADGPGPGACWTPRRYPSRRSAGPWGTTTRTTSRATSTRSTA